MKKAGKIIYMGIGIGLLAATLLTGQYGLSEEDIATYMEAVELQEEMEKVGFPEFHLTDYPVAFFDGNYDYVITANEELYDIQRRQPVVDTFVGTAYPVDDHYEVLMPTLEKFQDMIGILSSGQQAEALSNGDETALESVEYGKKEQIAVMWHEVFHCYQSTYYMEEIENLLQGHDFSEGDLGDGEGMIVEEVDGNAQVQAYLEQELKLLEQAAVCEDIDTLKGLILEYKELEQKRQALLEERVLVLEEYYKTLEGSAYYVEGCVYRNLYSEAEFQAEYVDNIDEYSNGSGKYYAMGMAECMIMDKLDENWKMEYDYSEELIETIYESLGIQ